MLQTFLLCPLSPPYPSSAPSSSHDAWNLSSRRGGGRAFGPRESIDTPNRNVEREKPGDDYDEVDEDEDGDEDEDEDVEDDEDDYENHGRAR